MKNIYVCSFNNRAGDRRKEKFIGEDIQSALKKAETYIKTVCKWDRYEITSVKLFKRWEEIEDEEDDWEDDWEDDYEDEEDSYYSSSLNYKLAMSENPKRDLLRLISSIGDPDEAFDMLLAYDSGISGIVSEFKKGNLLFEDALYMAAEGVAGGVILAEAKTRAWV